MDHWEDVEEYDRRMRQAEDGEEYQNEDTDKKFISSGSFHCKSALRSHISNMKLFLYRRDYEILKEATSSDPYNEAYLVLLSDLWRCFFDGTHDLNQDYDPASAICHAIPGTAMKTYLSSVRQGLTNPDYLTHIMSAEVTHLFDTHVDSRQFQNIVFDKLSGELSSLLNLMIFVNLCVLLLNIERNEERPDISRQIPGISLSITDDVLMVTYNSHLAVFICGQAVRFRTPGYDQILQKDLFLTLTDKINERFNVIFTSYILSDLANKKMLGQDVKDSNISTCVLSIIKFGDKIIRKYGNYGFELLGKFEAYCVSALLRYDNPSIWDNMEFQNNLLEAERKDNPTLYSDAASLCSLLNEFTEQELAEVHGLWRIWGHPIIDLVGGLDKMEQTSLKQPNVSKIETAIGERTFKLIYFKNYFRRHGHYPLSTMTDRQHFDLYRDHLKDRDIIEYEANSSIYDDDDYIMKKIRKNQNIDEENAFYKHKSWDKVQILQSFQIPASMNLATMIKDKAISMTRSELVHSISTRNTVFDSEKRRGVLKWLGEQTYKIKDFLSCVDKDGLNTDDLIIGLYPKEREMKIKARFFSLMSYVMRMYVTITEELLGKYVLKYFPMITMSDNLLDMIIRLYNMTTNVGVNNTSVTYSMNIDFSKWNQNMRERTNASVFSNLDRVFGLRSVISRTHDLFRKSYIYLCSGEYVPTIIRSMLTTISPYSRIGDESGKEGLRQKGWTITTVCDIVSLAYLHKAQIELIGGGDNQVLTVTFKAPKTKENMSHRDILQRIRKRMERFRSSLAKKMEKRGLPLKLEETWISHRLLMYNKIMYLEGVPLKGRLKVASRIFSNSNAGIMTLGNISSTLGTGFQSLSAKDYTPSLAWIMSRALLLVNISQFYQWNPICGTTRLDKQILLSYKRKKEGQTYYGGQDRTNNTKLKTNIDFTGNHTLSKEELMIILLYYHKVLGGPGIGTPYSYIMKGFPDPLSEGLTFTMKTIKHISDTKIKRQLQVLCYVTPSPVQHWEHLLEDPVSINHNAPAHGLAALRSSAEKILKQADIRNIKFKELTDLGDNQYLKDLSETLCMGSQLEPRLLHDIAGATLPGYVNTIISKVDQSTTLNKLASGHDVIADIYNAEMEYFMYLSTKIKIGKGISPENCPTETAQKFRNNTWGKIIIGVTTPHPAAYLASSRVSRGHDDCDENFVLVHVKKLHHVGTKRGPFRPYFGSYTKEKFKQSQMAAAYGDEDLLKRAIKIQKLLRWRYEEGTAMYRLIQSILSCVTDADPDKFLPTAEEITGDVEHRYHDMATKHGGIPTNLIQPYTFTSCNTSTFINHSKGAGNESLHFQALIIYSCMSAYMQSMDKDLCTDTYHFHESCFDCIKPIYHGDQEAQQLQQSVSLLSCPTNNLTYVKESEIPVHYHHIIKHINGRGWNDPRYPIVEVIGSHDLTSYSCMMMIINEIISEGSNMTSSGLMMMVEMLESELLLSIITIWIMYYMITVKNIPFMSANHLDIIEFYLTHKHIIDMILLHKSFTSYNRDMGYILSFESSSNGIPDCPEILQDWREYTIGKLPLEDTCIKLTDPEFTSSYIIWKMMKNPSCGICRNCMDMVIRKNHASDSTDNNCTIHGEIVEPKKYHIHSLDSLLKSVDKPLMFESFLPKESWLITKISSSLAETSNNKRVLSTDRAEDTRKRLKQFDNEGYPNSSSVNPLSHNITKLVFKTPQRKLIDKINERKRRFMYTSHTKKMVASFFIFPWKKWDVSTHEVSRGGTLYNDDVSLVTKTLWNLSLPPIIGKSLNSTAAVHLIIQLILCNQKIKGGAKDEKEMGIMFCLEWDMNTLSWFPKMVQLLQSSFRDTGLRNLKIGIFASQYTSVESNLHMNIESMVVETRNNIILKKGDGIKLMWEHHVFFSPVEHSRDYDCIISDTPDTSLWAPCSVYYICTQATLLPISLGLRDIARDKSSQHIQCDVFMPERLISDEAGIVLVTNPILDQSYIDLEILLDIASNVISTYNDGDIDHIVRLVRFQDTKNCITKHIIKTCVRSDVGITDRMTFDYMIKSLGNSLLEYVMVSDASRRFDWRSTLIIRIITSLYILCSQDQKKALDHYMKYNSISYSKNDNRALILQRQRITNNKGSYVNGTNSIYGTGLATVLREISTWLHIEYRAEFDLTRKLMI
ncbi:MAG: RNA-dependent RNA polymerase [Betanucleorhabdovirus picridis]|uniref:RNA-directed RNA polymerase n=1 Tax=Picris betanucleorhabdovirus 1 TaxID=2950849 RepID=A0AAE9MSH8_9RHAB|nr:MAG: RNA-dependent RNA polymerase [Picris betanucleorhabdovirus 1]